MSDTSARVRFRAHPQRDRALGSDQPGIAAQRLPGPWSRGGHQPAVHDGPRASSGANPGGPGVKAARPYGAPAAVGSASCSADPGSSTSLRDGHHRSHNAASGTAAAKTMPTSATTRNLVFP
jgi:hypothetical protein